MASGLGKSLRAQDQNLLVPPALTDGAPTPFVPLAGEPDTAELLRRLDAAEQRIAELESGPPQAWRDRMGPAARIFDWNEDDPDSGIRALYPESADAPEEEKKKQWYDRIGIRGYTQFRYNGITRVADDSAPPQHAGDSSIDDAQMFLIRRARLILSGDISEHMFLYFQYDFAVTPPGSPDATSFSQLRDLYTDLYIDTDQVFRFRVGQSKVPFGWENLQSSSNRVPLDRDDALNSAVRNERDLGIFFYYTPVAVRTMFKEIMDEGLKHSGNYGMFGFGAYNGQGGSFMEQNDDLHLVARLTIPYQFANGQYVEVGMQGYTGQYVVLGAPIRPLGQGPTDIIPAGTKQGGNADGLLDQRLAWSFNYYPQPFGFQAEWEIGQGPCLNDDQTAVVVKPLQGGYAMFLYQIEDCWGTWFPFLRWQLYEGGYKSFRNAPASYVNEWDMGFEWQIRPEMELTLAYTFTDRTNLTAISSSAAASEESYRQFIGQIARVQFQVNY